MRLWDFYRSKKYLKRMLLTLSSLIILSGSIFSYIFFQYTQDMIMSIQNDFNKKVLAQINYNIEYMNGVVRSNAISLFFDNDLISLMTSSEPDQMDLQTKRNKIDKFAGYTPYIDSIVVYSGASRKYYWGGNWELQDPDNIRYKNISALLKSGNRLPKMKLFPLTADLFTMVIYDSSQYKEGESALFINIETKWLFDNIKILNQLAGQINESILIIDESGRTITPSVNSGLKKTDTAEIIHKIPNNEELEGYFTYDSLSGEKLISYMNVPGNGWKIISVVPLKMLMGQVDRLKSLAVFITIIFLLVSVLAVFWISHHLYKPIGKLFNALKPSKMKGQDLIGKGDEFIYISDVYNQALEKSRNAQLAQDSTNIIARQFLLRKLIHEGQTISDLHFYDFMKENALNAESYGTYLLCVIKFDKPKVTISPQDKKLYNFAVSNIAQEVAASRYRCETVEIRQEHVVLLIHTHVVNDEIYKELKEGLKEVQEIVLRMYGMTFSAAIGDGGDQLDRLSYFYNQTLHYLNYKYIFGPGSIISPDLIRVNLNNEEFNLPVELEKKLVESIKLNENDVFAKTLDRIFQHISIMKYDYIDYMIIHVLLLIKIALKELNNNRIQSIVIDLSDANVKLLTAESMEESKSILSAYFREISDRMNHQEKDYRNEVLMAAIKEMIDSRYSEVNLSIQVIADTMRLSPAYVNKLFKQHYGLSVADYINDIRLHYVDVYLQENKYTINEIIEIVGFSNRSVFFRLFKNKYGTTPKEYRISKSLMEH